MRAISLPEFERDLRAALDRARHGGSLVFVDDGKQIAAILPSTSNRASEPAGSLVDFFLRSPLVDSGIEIDRDGAKAKMGNR